MTWPEAFAAVGTSFAFALAIRWFFRALNGDGGHDD